jgi:hypothetical protein
MGNYERLLKHEFGVIPIPQPENEVEVTEEKLEVKKEGEQ